MVYWRFFTIFVVANCRTIIMRQLVFTLFLSFAFTSVSAQVECGKATFYKLSDEGSRTSSGEILHNSEMVCAHKTHPFGTLLRVKNLKNGREVVVRVIDRGPFSKNRIIDLSYGAAQTIGMITSGVVDCEITVVGEYDETTPLKSASDQTPTPQTDRYAASPSLLFEIPLVPKLHGEQHKVVTAEKR